MSASLSESLRFSCREAQGRFETSPDLSWDAADLTCLRAKADVEDSRGRSACDESMAGDLRTVRDSERHLVEGSHCSGNPRTFAGSESHLGSDSLAGTQDYCREAQGRSEMMQADP